jgi:hypothetical protein
VRAAVPPTVSVTSCKPPLAMYRSQIR